MADFAKAVSNNCPDGMIYWPGGTYEGKNFRPLCVDEHEFSGQDLLNLSEEDFQRSLDCESALAICPSKSFAKENPLKPLVEIMSGKGAKNICGVIGKRLPTHQEWQAIASNLGTKEYSTRSGDLDKGVYYNEDEAREVCDARGLYMEYGGKEVCDMNGNVNEWTWDPYAGDSGKYYICGGSFGDKKESNVSAEKCVEPGRGYNIYSEYVGFRCVKDAE